MPTSKRPQNRQPPWQDREAGPASFGLWLKQQRELRGVALRDIADETKISLRYLEALESNRFDVLPAQVFVRGFLRQYARYVGLDADEAVNAFLTALGAQVNDAQEGDESEEPRSARRSMGGRGWLLALIVASVAAVMVLAALAAFSWRQSREGPGVSAAPAPQSSDSARAAAARPSDEKASHPQAPPAGAAAVPAAGSHPSAPVVAAPSAATPEAGNQPPAAAVAAEQGAQGGAGQSPATAPIVVTLDFAAECWVDAVSDDSHRVSELAVQGESLRLEAQRQVTLTLGDGDAVHVQVNGRPFILPASRHKVRHLVIDLATVAAQTPGGSPGHE